MSSNHAVHTAPDRAAHTAAELTETASTFLVGAGILTMALFPLALPMIALLLVAAIPLLAFALAAGVIAAALAAPVLLLRGLRRRRSRAPAPRRAPSPSRHGPMPHDEELVANG